MLKIFKKRKNVFLKLIQEQADLTLKGLEILVAYIDNPTTALADDMRLREKEADEARRILIFELNKSFITPFDREDIFSLSRAIDDILDYAYSTVTEITILNVVPTTYMSRMAKLLKDAAYEIQVGVSRLEDHPGVAGEHAQRAKALENKVEDIYREALADMFNNVTDPMQVVNILKMREVYRHLSNAADRGDEAANVIADIVVKIA